MTTTNRFTVPRTFTVPGTIEGVRGLLTARGWEKAAIVYAYTKPETPGRRLKLVENSSDIPTEFPCGMKAFARLGVVGLRDFKTVAKYRDRWQDAIDAGKATTATPGQKIDVPDMPWPSTSREIPRGSGAQDVDSQGKARANIVAALTKSGSSKYLSAIENGTMTANEAWAAYICEPHVVLEQEKARNDARSRQYTTIGNALLTLGSWRNDDVRKLMAEFDSAILDPPELARYFDMSNLEAAAQMVDGLIQWRRDRPTEQAGS